MKFTFEITSIEEAEARLAMPTDLHPDHLISIGAPWDPKPKGLESFKGNLLRLVFCDVKTPPASPSVWERRNISTPAPKHVKELIRFGRSLESGHLLVHCEMGISRSTAATLIVLAANSDPSNAKALEASIYRNRAIARPNDWMLSMADEMLGWDGKLAAMGGWFQPGRESFYGLPLVRG